MTLWMTSAFLVGAILMWPSAGAYASKQPHTAEWYCTQGAEMLQAGQHYSEKTSPLEWDVDLLAQARSDFIRCRNMSDPDSATRNRAFLGIAVTDTDISQMAATLALYSYSANHKEPAQAFTQARNAALWYARDGLTVLNGLQRRALDSIDTDAYSVLSKDAAALQKIKARTLKLTLSNVPRSKVELEAFLNANPEYLTYSTAVKDWGIPKSVLCRRDKHSASVVSQSTPDYSAVQVAPENAKVIIAVGVGADSRITSVHIQTSSGNDLVDEAALKAAYTSTYRAGSLLCNPVAGTVILTFTYQ